MIINFYNTGGRYINAANSRVDASSNYYAGINRKCVMDISAAQMELFSDAIGSASIRMYNRGEVNASYSFYAFASKLQYTDEAITEEICFGKTEVQNIVPYPAWRKHEMDVTSCFQYAQRNWPGEAWYLWFVWTSGEENVALLGYDNSNYSAEYAPYFTIELISNESLRSYMWRNDPQYCTFPEAAMTSNSSQNCIASASSTYSSTYPVWRCFDKSTTTKAWASSSSASTPQWVQLAMPKKLYSISVTIKNRGDRTDNINAPISGAICGSNDGGVTFVDIGSFSGRSNIAGDVTVIECSNYDVGYDIVRVRIDTWNGKAYAALGEISISGMDQGPNGKWTEVVPYVFNGEEFVLATDAVILRSET